MVVFSVATMVDVFVLLCVVEVILSGIVFFVVVILSVGLSTLELSDGVILMSFTVITVEHKIKIQAVKQTRLLYIFFIQSPLEIGVFL